jgi:hypothetical protein
VPSPNSSTSVPSTLTVAKASTRLRSVEPKESSAPHTIVTSPTATSVPCHTGVPPSTGERRASRYTPAFTMVAACR